MQRFGIISYYAHNLHLIFTCSINSAYTRRHRPRAARRVRDERYGTREAIELFGFVLNLWINLELSP